MDLLFYELSISAVLITFFFSQLLVDTSYDKFSSEAVLHHFIEA